MSEEKNSEYDIKIEGEKEKGEPILITGFNKDGQEIDLFTISYDLNFDEPYVSVDKQSVSLTLTFEVEAFQPHKIKINQSVSLGRSVIQELAKRLDLIQ